ncbi:MAG: phosphoribosylglycinamide formyltransferase [Thermodesulfobacteriota bacterium]
MLGNGYNFYDNVNLFKFELISMNDIEIIYKPKNEPMSLAVFISGSGRNFLAIYEEQKRLQELRDKNYGRVEVVFTNVPNSNGAYKARNLGISVISLSSKQYFEILQTSAKDDQVRDYYDAATITLIESICSPDFIVLAGYRRRFGDIIIHRYKNRILNLYPGDITKPYLVRGVDAPIQALRAGEKNIKCTVFLERAKKRFGPSIIQSEPISLEGYTENDIELMKEKIRKGGEWIIYPFAIHHLIAKGRLGIDENDCIYVDGEKMPEEGYQLKNLINEF